MELLGDNIFAYTTLDNALKEVEGKIKNTQSNNAAYFYKGDNYLSDYVKSVMELRKSMANFNNLFEDYMMELEQAEYEKWETEQGEIENEYYSETPSFN